MKRAIRQTLTNLNGDYLWIVYIGLDRFFNAVHHDRLMTLAAKKIKDGDVISLVRKFLVSSRQTDDSYKESIIGTLQGGLRLISP